MADATVKTTSGRFSPTQDVFAVKITVTGDSTNYATATGGFPFDLYSTLAAAGPFSAPINYNDIVGFVPFGVTSTGFSLDSFTVGTATATTLPCTIRMYGSNAAAQGAQVEIADAAISPVFSGLLLIARGGTN